MKNFKLSAFADEAGISAGEQIDALKANGIQYMEIRNIDGKNILDCSDDELKKIKEKLDGGGIKVSSIGSPVGKTPITDDFDQVKKSFERALAAAKILEAPYIRAFSFYVPKGSDPAPWEDEVVRRLTELVRTARLEGRQYALENESGIYTDIPSRCVRILDRVEGLVLALDPGNFIMNNADLLQAWNLLKNRTAYFHIKDATREPRHFVPAGEGEGHIAEILKDAYSGGFNGFLSVEPHLKYLENLTDAQRFTKAVKALKKILDTI
ncbi:MAG: sugar phosphate isomerase/epimerase [Treponema sp.]|nr:sugar phosphate isomerase/epimerase [Treponema sp.]